MNTVNKTMPPKLVLRGLRERVPFDRYAIFKIESNALGRLLPELMKCKDVTQGLHHQFDVFNHSIQAAFHAASFADICRMELSLDIHPAYVKAGMGEILTQGFRIKAKTALNELMDGVEKADLFLLAVLLHDIGKPSTKQQKNLKDGRTSYSFPGHASKGAELAERACKRLGLTQKQTEYVASIVKHHKDLSRITKSVAERFEYDNGLTLPSVRAALQRENIVVETVLMTIADVLASGSKYPADLMKDIIATLREFV